MILEINDPSHFKNLLECTKPIVTTDLHFEVGEKFVINEINAPRTAMIYCALNREYFEAYDVPKEEKFAVDSSTFLTSFGMFTKFKKVKLELLEGEIKLYASEGRSRKTSKIPLLADSEGESNRPNVEYPTILKLPSGDFKDSLKDCALFGNTDYLDTVELSNTQEEFKIKFEREDRTAKNEDGWSITDDLIMVIQDSSTQEYGLDDLKEMADKGGKLSKFVTISFGKNLPIKLGYMIEHGVLEYILAPVIR